MTIMTFKDLYPVTQDVCGLCVLHIEYGCADRECVVFGKDPDATMCPDHKRLRRTLLHADAVDATLGCVRESDDDDHDCTDMGFTYGSCDLCGVLGGDREHVTTWHRNEPVREFERNGWTIAIHSEGARFWVAADRAGNLPRSLFGIPHDGSQRYALLAMFVGLLPA